MKTNTSLLSRGTLWLCGLLIFSAGTVQAQDSFGTVGNEFTIDFVEVGNAGNANDAGAGGGSYSSPYGGVGYDYRISTYAISQNDITKATASDLINVSAGAHSLDRPAANISWYEAAAYVNWMNTSNGHQEAYNLTFDSEWSMTLWGVSEQAITGVRSGTNAYRHKDAFYFLPSEDEWYKAAYHKNDGVTPNYWDYATGSNSAPTAVASGTNSGSAVYGGQSGPADVDLAGGLSPYGTMGQNGNVWEWNESAFDGFNVLTDGDRSFRGGRWLISEAFLRSSNRNDFDPTVENSAVGFRVASIPEPSTVLLALFSVGVIVYLRRWKISL